MARSVEEVKAEIQKYRKERADQTGVLGHSRALAGLHHITKAKVALLDARIETLEWVLAENA